MTWEDLVRAVICREYVPSFAERIYRLEPTRAIQPRYSMDEATAARTGAPERWTLLEVASDALFHEHQNLANNNCEPDPRTVEAHRLLREVIDERRARFGTPDAEGG